MMLQFLHFLVIGQLLNIFITTSENLKLNPQTIVVYARVGSQNAPNKAIEQSGTLVISSHRIILIGNFDFG